MKKNILIIDDNQNFIDLYSQVFEVEFNIDAVNTLNEALSILESDKFKYDLILCDIFMPEINGFEVYDFFMSQDRYKHLSIIFKTSSLNKSVIDESIINKGVELISTYMSNDEIMARVKKSISQSKVIKLVDSGSLLLVINKESNKSIYPKLSIPFEFTDTEVKIIETLSLSKKLISKKELIKSAFSKDKIVTDNNFNTTLTNLRKKLGPAGVSISAKRNSGLSLCYQG
ncbi:MAG: response regulator transcription factor [Bacteriovoracaceae bacterium]